MNRLAARVRAAAETCLRDGRQTLEITSEILQKIGVNGEIKLLEKIGLARRVGDRWEVGTWERRIVRTPLVSRSPQTLTRMLLAYPADCRSLVKEAAHTVRQSAEVLEFWSCFDPQEVVRAIIIWRAKRDGNPALSINYVGGILKSKCRPVLEKKQEKSYVHPRIREKILRATQDFYESNQHLNDEQLWIGAKAIERRILSRAVRQA